LLPLSIGCFCCRLAQLPATRGTAQTISDAEKIMWLLRWRWRWCSCCRTQRSTRYLIPAMPALAVVIALYRRIGRILFSLTLAGSYDRFAGDGSDRPRRGAGKRKTHGFTAVLVFVSGAALACLAGIQSS
jgi:hypothetical protein